VKDVARGYPPELKHERLSIWLSIPVMLHDGTRVTRGAGKHRIHSCSINFLAMTVIKQQALCGNNAFIRLTTTVKSLVVNGCLQTLYVLGLMTTLSAVIMHCVARQQFVKP